MKRQKREKKTMDSFKSRKKRIVDRTKNTKEKKKPQLIVWKDAKILKRHSIKIPINEILSLISQLDVVKINIIGNPSTGKSTLAMTLAHLLHKHAKIKFAVRVLSREDLSRFKDILGGLNSNVNWILVFDDISFLSANLSKKEIENIQKEFTEIRHLSNGKDIKVICIFNFHYTMSVSKYLRQSDFSFYTSVGKSDFDNVVKTFGKTATRNLKAFTRLHGMAYSPMQKFIVMFTKDKKITYHTRKPFAPILFFNSFQSNIFVFPHRNWIDEHCVTCDKAQSNNTDEVKEEDMQEFNDNISKTFGKGLIKRALRMMAFINGINTYDMKIQRCMQAIENWSTKRKIPLQKFLDYYDLKENDARLRGMPKAVFEATKDDEKDDTEKKET